MSAIPPANQQEQQTPQQPAQPNAAPQQQNQGLPPTGLQQQLASLNNYYNNVQNMQLGGSAAGQGGNIGFNVRQAEFQQSGGGQALQDNQQVGSSTLDQMAKNLAQRYGLPIGKGRLVDENGNFMMTPQQLSDASGGKVTLGEAAAQMNYISDAVTRRQNEQQQQKGLAALQTGLGQVQSRGRGSLAALTSGYYQDIANLYANKEYEAADFSYYIQKEQLDIATRLQDRAEKLAKKQAQGQFVAGVGLTIVGLYTGNYAAVGQGVSMAGGSAGSTGWF